MVSRQSGGEAHRLTSSRRSVLLLPALGSFLQKAAFAADPQLHPTTRILCGGDVMLSRYVGTRARRLSDPAAPLRDLATLFSSADIAFVNLEAPFSDHGRPVEKGMVFKAEPAMIEALRLAHIAVVSTANNHARDCGAYGVDFTVDWLGKNGIAAAGTGHTAEEAHRGALIERNGHRFGFLAYTYDQSNGNHPDQDDRVAMMFTKVPDTSRMAADVASLRARADAVIVSMHAGVEYQKQPNAEQRRFAHAAIDAGASVVVGAHPHVTQAVESYREGVIFYSLGNLVFDQFQRKETQHGLIADLHFTGAKLESYSTIPVDIVSTVPRVAPQPVPQHS
jgi:poly-gamma-glutamate capsule biosynthesis protein CapA/YwtB (metallophosphatase superfamily)